MLLVLAVAAAIGCGRSSGVSTPAPAQPTFNIKVDLFYDENGDGAPNAGENVRLPNVRLRAGSATAVTTSTGEASLFVTAGSQALTADPSSLPPYFTVAPLAIDASAAGDIALAARLPIGSNRPNTYMGVGDSTTSISGYLDDLRVQLDAYFGAAHTINEGIFGSRSEEGSARIYDDLAHDRPAYTLILYGVNDWNEAFCQSRFPCGTVDNLRYMVQAAKAMNSLPIIATILPVNVGYSKDATPERNVWIANMNALIRKMAAEEGAVLVDLEKAFLAQPDLRPLFIDYVHPSPEGRALMAHEFFLSITTRR